MTKKEFKEMCDVHVYTGGGRRLTAIFFDWKSGMGYKYMVKGYSTEVLRAELFSELYKWVTTGDSYSPPYNIDIRFAPTEDKRFKVPISMR